MKQEEITVKGIIFAVYSQGEYGRRISLLSDSLGKITVFAQGAAKQNSKIIGACRPFVCGEFTLSGGKNAWNLHGVQVMESFEEIPMDPDTAFIGSYILEFASYFTEEGMTEEDAKSMLNLIYVTLMALKKNALRKEEVAPEIIRRVFELKMLVHEGIYTEAPVENEENCTALWEYVIHSPLSSLYDNAVWNRLRSENGKISKVGDSFLYSVKHLKNSQVPHKFKSEELLQG